MTNAEYSKIEKKYKESFKVVLQSLMNEKDINQTRLAKETYIDSNTIRNYLDGNTLPNGTNSVKLAQYFDVSISYLYGETDSRNADTIEICNKFATGDRTIENLEQIKKLNQKFDNKYSDILYRILTNPALYANLLKQIDRTLNYYSDETYMKDIDHVLLLEYKRVGKQFSYEEIADILSCQQFLELYHDYITYKLIGTTKTKKSKEHLERKFNELNVQRKAIRKILKGYDD